MVVNMCTALFASSKANTVLSRRPDTEFSPAFQRTFTGDGDFQMFFFQLGNVLICGKDADKKPLNY